MIHNYRSRCVPIRFSERINKPPITFRIGAFQPLSVTKIMPKKICSNGNRRPIRYENWNGAIAIRYDGNIV